MILSICPSPFTLGFPLSVSPHHSLLVLYSFFSFIRTTPAEINHPLSFDLRHLSLGIPLMSPSLSCLSLSDLISYSPSHHSILPRSFRYLSHSNRNPTPTPRLCAFFPFPLVIFPFFWLVVSQPARAFVSSPSFLPHRGGYICMIAAASGGFQLGQNIVSPMYHLIT